MAKIVRFPPTVEIKRVIAAASRAGIAIGSVEIHPTRVLIHVREPGDTRPEEAYDRWKLSVGQNPQRGKQVDE